MLWLISALLAAIFHAWANILDNYLVNHSFKQKFGLFTLEEFLTFYI